MQNQEVTMVDINSMPPEERRVLIAKDAIALLEAGAIMARHDTYLTGARVDFDSQRHAQVHTLIPDWLSKGCSACALGTALIAAVQRFDDLEVGALIDAESGDYHHNYFVHNYFVSRIPLTHYMTRFFDPAQLDMIEGAFEGHVGRSVSRSSLSAEQFEHCHKYYQDRVYWMGTRELMLSIFRNIVKNNGEFVPEDG